MQFEKYSGTGIGDDPSLLRTDKKYKFTNRCLCCGLKFKTNSPQKLFCDRVHYLPCPICGKLVLKKDRNFTTTPKCCSGKCAHELRKRSMPKKICVICGREFVPRTGAGCICDDDHYRECVICGKKFLIDRKDHERDVCSLKCSNEKTRRFYQEKYGYDHPMQNPEVRKHHEQAMKEKYGVTHALKLEKFMKQQQETVVKTNMERYGVPYASLLPQNIESRGCNISKINLEAKDYLESKGCNCKLEKSIVRYTYDIVLEESKTAIEINPSATHNILQDVRWGGGVSADYHLKKTKNAEENGYRCIHIFEWDDMKKVLDIAIPKTKIYAEDCTIYKLKSDVAKDFIQENDIKGNCRGQLLFLGLVKDGEIYQVMTFGEPRYSKHHTVEMMRLCNRRGYQVSGGASKLFKFATEDFGLDNIVAYCDISKYTGDVFKTIGMKYIRSNPPQEIWSKNKKYITSSLLRQKGARYLLEKDYPENLTNEEIMIENKWLPVFDCGMKVFEYKSKNS